MYLNNMQAFKKKGTFTRNLKLSKSNAPYSFLPILLPDMH